MQALKYADILERLKEFDDWLVSLGVTPRNDDRIHKAFETLRMAETATRKGRETGEYTNIQATDLFPLIEALEAHDVFLAFRDDKSENLTATLKRALSGPAQPIAETHQNSDGRNVWFELALAAAWRSRGATVELGEPDLQLVRGDKKFLIACKRPASEHSIRSNIRGAISQLNENLSSAPPEVFGVTAISLSRVMNPGDKYWSGSLEQLGNLLQNRMSEYKPYWAPVDVDPRVCSILLHIATPSDVGKTVDVALATYTVAGALNEPSAGTKAFEEHVLEMKASGT